MRLREIRNRCITNNKKTHPTRNQTRESDSSVFLSFCVVLHRCLHRAEEEEKEKARARASPRGEERMSKSVVFVVGERKNGRVGRHRKEGVFERRKLLALSYRRILHALVFLSIEQREEERFTPTCIVMISAKERKEQSSLSIMSRCDRS